MASKSRAKSPVEDLSYEDARDELATIVATLESGGLALEESLALWERGEVLAAHCESWLAAARARVEPGDDPGDDDGPGVEDEDDD